MKKIRLVLPPPKEQKKLRVAAYCRVSTKSKAQKESLRNQILYYTERILDNDNWEFAGVYYDFGKTGLRKKGRAGLERMLKQADKLHTYQISKQSVKRHA